MISVNARALEIARRMAADAEALGLVVSQLANGATVLDAGVHTSGSLEAGRLFAEVCLGGLGKVRFAHQTFVGAQDPIENNCWLPSLSVSVSHPVVACMASQYAGWAVKADKYFAMGSGPARARYAGEPLFEKLAYRDQAEVAVLTLEGRELPTQAVADKVAKKCGVAPENLYLLIAPTASLVGSVQVAARVVETGLHKMLEVGFDIDTVVTGYGTCPLPSIAKNDLKAIGRTNDAVLYGGQAWYTVETGDADIEAVIERLPSSSSRDYGTPFYDLFKRYDGDFYKIDPLLFSPAEVFINNLSSGHVFHAGQVDAEMIQRVLLA